MKRIGIMLLVICLVQVFVFSAFAEPEVLGPAQAAEPVKAEEATPAPEPTAPAPEAEPIPGPEPEPEPGPESEPESGGETEAEPVIEGKGPAWIATERGRRYGKLEELIPVANGAIFIRSDDVLTLSDYTLAELKAVSFEPDRDAFPSKKATVMVSELDPNGESKENTLFIWVVAPKDLPKEPESPLDDFELVDEEPTEMEIRVEALLNDGGLPTYALSSLPALGAGETFAVSLDGGEPVKIQGDRFTPDAPCTLRFYALDEAGNQLAKSAKVSAEPSTEAQPDDMGEPPMDEQDAPPTEAGDTPGGQDEPSGEGNEPDGQGAPPSGEGEQPSGEVTDEADAGIALEKKALQTPPPTAAPVEIEISVRAIDYFPGEVSNVAPTFILSGLPKAGDYRYAVMINGDDPEAFDGNSYTATQEGSYTLRFAIVDADGVIAALSGKYTVALDFSAPAGKAQAWMAAADGSRQYGTLAGLIARASAGATIYVSSTDVIELSGGANALSGIRLAPDPNVFGGSHTVRVSKVHPSTSEVGGPFVWVEAVSDPGRDPGEVELRVTPENYHPGKWMNSAPVFALEVVPDTADVSLAVIVDEGTPVLLPGDTYTADAEGRYGLTFALLNGAGQVVAQSARYDVAVDRTPPTLRVETGEAPGMTVYVSDALSEQLQVSLNAGKIWNRVKLLPDGSLGYRYANAQGQFPIGSIQARDEAGNVATYGQDVAAGGGMMTGPGGSGSSRKISHSSADDSSTIAYDAVPLSAGAGEMSVLALGGEQLDLSIANASPSGGQEPAAFTVELAAWNDAAVNDALVLSAVLGEGSGECAFQWDFTGATCKKLFASGIDYLVLRVGDRQAAISTAGFTAGTRYDMLKSGGVSSKAFFYSVLMGVPEPEMVMGVDVEGEYYFLSDDQGSEMYYYDVYLGNKDMMDKAFGASA